MRRGLYTSNYTGIPAYLMDFGFGGFLGYGRRVSCCVGEEELKMYEIAISSAGWLGRAECPVPEMVGSALFSNVNFHIPA